MTNSVSIKNKIKNLKGNPALLIPILSLEEFAGELTEDEAQLLSEMIDTLGLQYFYLGEFVFEYDREDFYRFEKQPTNFREYHTLINKIMGQFSLKKGCATNYNNKDALAKKAATPIPNEHGVRRQDKVRDALMAHFGGESESEQQRLGLNVTPSVKLALKLDKDKQGLTITFNLTAKSKKAMKENALDPREIASIAHHNLARATISPFLQKIKSGMTTNEAIKEFGSKRPTKVKIDSKNIEVSIPLNDVVYGAFKRGNIPLECSQTAQKITHSIGRELNASVLLAACRNQIG